MKEPGPLFEQTTSFPGTLSICDTEQPGPSWVRQVAGWGERGGWGVGSHLVHVHHAVVHQRVCLLLRLRFVSLGQRRKLHAARVAQTHGMHVREAMELFVGGRHYSASDDIPFDFEGSSNRAGDDDDGNASKNSVQNTWHNLGVVVLSRATSNAPFLGFFRDVDIMLRQSFFHSKRR